MAETERVGVSLNSRLKIHASSLSSLKCFSATGALKLPLIEFASTC